MTTLALTTTAPESWRVSFNNPPSNMVTPEVILELQELVDRLEHDPHVTVVVFDSAVEGAFLGPYDVSRAAETPSDPGPSGLPPWLDLTTRLSRLPGRLDRPDPRRQPMSGKRVRAGVRSPIRESGRCGHRSTRGQSSSRPRRRRNRTPSRPHRSRARELELILGSVVIDAATAELYGVVNRALPEAEIQDNVNELASKIAGYDRRVIAEAKALVDQQTLPTDADLVTAYQTFFASVARRTA
jgi:enoyl-CoA hydratase/carnithine racemase